MKINLKPTTIEQVKKETRKWYIIYPFLFLILFFSKSNILDIIIISIIVLFLLMQQGYYMYHYIKLNDSNVGF